VPQPFGRGRHTEFRTKIGALKSKAFSVPLSRTGQDLMSPHTLPGPKTSGHVVRATKSLAAVPAADRLLRSWPSKFPVSH
jgi:hypothetical protein